MRLQPNSDGLQQKWNQEGAILLNLLCSGMGLPTGCSAWSPVQTACAGECCQEAFYGQSTAFLLVTT